MPPEDLHPTQNGICVICSNATDWKDDNTIDRSFHYVDGCGQLCRRCYQTLYAEEKTVGKDGICFNVFP